MRNLLIIFSVIFFISLTSCNKRVKESSELLSLVPPKTAVILKTDDLGQLVENLKQNPVINSNQNLPLFTFFKNSYAPLTHLQLSEESLWTFSKIGRDEIATTLITTSTPKLLDSIGYEEIKGFTYNGKEIKEYKIEDKIIYGIKLNDVFAFGDSKLIIEHIIRLASDNFNPNEELEKVFKSSSDKKNSIFINTPEFESLYNVLTPNQNTGYLKDFSNWIGLDLDIKNNRFHFSGVSIPKKNEVLGVLNNTKPQENEMALITPSGASGFYSFTYDKFQQLKENISFYRKADYPKINTDLLVGPSEVGMIYMGNKEAFVLKGPDEIELFRLLQTQSELVKSHRNHDIYSYEDANYFPEALSPLIKAQNLKFYTKLDQFFVFAAEENVLEVIISNFENKSVLAESETYQRAAKNLADKASILIVGNTKNLLKKIAEGVSSAHKKAYEEADFSSFSIAALQFIKHDHFTYINGDMPATQPGESMESGVQTQSFKPGEDISGGPWFFENWRTKDYDVVVQGKSNMLYVYDTAGKLRWKKQLDGPILGDIQPIDIYQNRRIQMAFNTSQTFYIIDREGSVVKPFNKTFKNTITQPLAVFDYNNNGKFRFLITQGNKLTMLDKTLKEVKGFEFTTAKSKILQSPKHFRIGSKDFILVLEESGKLNILNPRGQTRIKVDRNIDFSSNEWYLYKDLFTSTTSDGQLIQIDQEGGINLQNLKLDENNAMFATAKTLVTFSENTLNIKGKATKLDFGLYLEPKIFYLNDKLYISITDIQAHKVYLFDSNSKIFNGFPVYGNSVIDLQYFPNKGVKMAVKGEENSVLLYDVQ